MDESSAEIRSISALALGGCVAPPGINASKPKAKTAAKDNSFQDMLVNLNLREGLSTPLEWSWRLGRYVRLSLKPAAARHPLQRNSV